MFLTQNKYIRKKTWKLAAQLIMANKSVITPAKFKSIYISKLNIGLYSRHQTKKRKKVEFTQHQKTIV